MKLENNIYIVTRVKKSERGFLDSVCVVSSISALAYLPADKDSGLDYGLHELVLKYTFQTPLSRNQ